MPGNVSSDDRSVRSTARPSTPHGCRWAVPAAVVGAVWLLLSSAASAVGSPRPSGSDASRTGPGSPAVYGTASLPELHGSHSDAPARRRGYRPSRRRVWRVIGPTIDREPTVDRADVGLTDLRDGAEQRRALRLALALPHPLFSHQGLPQRE